VVEKAEVVPMDVRTSPLTPIFDASPPTQVEEKRSASPIKDDEVGETGGSDQEHMTDLRGRKRGRREGRSEEHRYCASTSRMLQAKHFQDQSVASRTRDEESNAAVKGLQRGSFMMVASLGDQSS
jgi:hypothetical protein